MRDLHNGAVDGIRATTIAAERAHTFPEVVIQLGVALFYADELHHSDITGHRKHEVTSRIAALLYSIEPALALME